MTCIRQVYKCHFYVSIFLAFLTIGIGTKLAAASPADEEVYAAFEWFCLSHLQKPQVIAGLFVPLGIQPLPGDKAVAFLAPQKGKAWLMPGSAAKAFVVSLTENGVCTVYGNYADGEETKRIFEKNIKNTKVSSEPMGSQTQDMYAISFPDAADGKTINALVSIVTTNLRSINGVVLSALPEKLALEKNIHVLNWPK